MAPGGHSARIHIIGGGGSGKTTLARRVAQASDVPHVELDVAGIDALEAQSGGWVTEGIFVYGVEPILAAADTVVWLDLPWRVARRRIVARHVRLSLARRNPHPGIRLLRQFLGSQRRYYTAETREPRGPTDWAAITRASTTRLLDAFAEKVVHLRKPSEVERWAAQLGA